MILNIDNIFEWTEANTMIIRKKEMYASLLEYACELLCQMPCRDNIYMRRCHMVIYLTQ